MQLATPLKDDDVNTKAICKLALNPESTGFFLRIQKKKQYNFLVTCYHSLYKSIQDENEVEIRLKDEKKYVIDLSCKERLIKCIEDKDIAAVEIIKKDHLQNSVHFLNLDANYINGYNQYKDKNIFGLYYYKKGKIYLKKGIISEINEKNFEFKHNIQTDEKSDGSPIILAGNSCVVGMHKKSSFGTFIDELIKELI